MNETSRYYQREEEFLDEYGHGGIVGAAQEAIRPDEWRPNYDCDDAARQQTDYAMKSGWLEQLTFKGAAAYHDTETRQFVRVQIILECAKRSITVEVRKDGDGFVARKLRGQIDECGKPARKIVK